MELTVYCPICGEYSAKPLYDKIFADPWEPVFECIQCGTFWRMNLYEVEKDNGT